MQGITRKMFVGMLSCLISTSIFATTPEASAQLVEEAIQIEGALAKIYQNAKVDRVHEKDNDTYEVHCADGRQLIYTKDDMKHRAEHFCEKSIGLQIAEGIYCPSNNHPRASGKSRYFCHLIQTEEKFPNHVVISILRQTTKDHPMIGSHYLPCKGSNGWFNVYGYFTCHLNTHTYSDSDDQEIQIEENLHIFDNDRYKLRKRNLKTGKFSGEIPRFSLVAGGNFVLRDPDSPMW